MKACKCPAGGHEPWCPRFVADVDATSTLPLNERESAAVQNAIQDTIAQGAKKFGVEAIRDALLSHLLANEKHIRKTFRPDHPALKVLDDYHEKKRLQGLE